MVEEFSFLRNFPQLLRITSARVDRTMALHPAVSNFAPTGIGARASPAPINTVHLPRRLVTRGFATL
jgi:hypothetical protein